MISRKDFSDFTDYFKVPHVEIKDKTLGLIGTGSIGEQVMKIAQVLEMNILTYSRTPKNYDNPNIKSVSLEELLKKVILFQFIVHLLKRQNILLIRKYWRK